MLYFFQYLILFVSLGYSIFAFLSPRLLEKSVFSIEGLARREYYRLLTSGFVHADYMHLAFNMLTFYWFAYLWSDIYVSYFKFPWWSFGVFYLGAIWVVNLVMWLIYRSRTRYVALGASGGVSAIVFSVIILFPWETLYVFIFSIPAILFAVLYIGYSAYALIFPRKGDNVGHAAHLVGAFYGLAFVTIFQANAWRLFFQQLLDHPF